MRSSLGVSTLNTFVLLAISIDADTSIKGVEIGDQKTVDDTTIFLKRYYLPYRNISVFKTIRIF